MCEGNKDSDQKGLLGSWFLLVAISAVLALMAGWALVIHTRVPIPHNSKIFTQDDWQAFADMFGAVVGTFFSALAFAFLIYTSRMQRIELSMQRKELIRTANAQEAAQEALTAQVKAAKQAARLSAATAILEHAERNIRGTSAGSRARKEAEEAIDEALGHLLRVFEEIENDTISPFERKD